MKLKAKSLALFCRQFAIMLSTGVSLVKALEVLEGQAEEAAFAKVLQTVRLDVASGTAFTKALEKHKEIFPNVFKMCIRDSSWPSPDILSGSKVKLHGEVQQVLPRTLCNVCLLYTSRCV